MANAHATGSGIHRRQWWKPPEADGCLALAEHASAGVGGDYRDKGQGTEATPLAVVMRGLYRGKGRELRDVEVVLDVWKQHTGQPQLQHFSDYKGAQKYRNWLAHGRHWILLGERYTITKVLDICKNLEDAVHG